MTANRTSPPMPETEAETIRFKCRACRQPMEADVDMMGTNIECSNCGKTIRIPLHVFSMNPFRRPIRRLVGNLTSIQWHFPFFPQFIEAIVLLFVVLVTTALYLTVGIASQIAGIFQSLMLDARHEIKTGNLVEKSAYAVAGGIYVLLWLPFSLVLLPFTLLGWIWKHLGYLGLILIAIIVAIGLTLFFKPELLSLLGIERQQSEPSAGAYGLPPAAQP